MAWVYNPDGELVNLRHIVLIRSESEEGGGKTLYAYGVPGKADERAVLARGLSEDEVSRAVGLIATRGEDPVLFRFPEELEEEERPPSPPGPFSVGPEPEDTPTGM